MKKSDLKVGMIIKVRNEECYIVTEGHHGLMGARVGCFLELHGINYDLTFKLTHRLDIMEVYETKRMYNIFETMTKKDGIVINSDCTLLWKREEPKEMTLEEIQEKLGYKIKIVEELGF